MLTSVRLVGKSIQKYWRVRSSVRHRTNGKECVSSSVLSIHHTSACVEAAGGGHVMPLSAMVVLAWPTAGPLSCITCPCTAVRSLAEPAAATDTVSGASPGRGPSARRAPRHSGCHGEKTNGRLLFCLSSTSGPRRRLRHFSLRDKAG
eukprot:TRINITY_DN274_c0_g4_i1.p3 TRINITY_DN274_c0_g4~~TRINITY_DN274_c0_g4_i1.p3  ORF type:complete len:148 (-),score=13.28 TRINITY_DN274_c0_g4_i1:271-714(-)